jgi:hypothetical protein
MLLKPPAGDPAKEVWAEWLVTILLVPGDGDSLILKDLSATEGRMPPSVPSQPPSPGRPPGPAAR